MEISIFIWNGWIDLYPFCVNLLRLIRKKTCADIRAGDGIQVGILALSLLVKKMYFFRNLRRASGVLRPADTRATAIWRLVLLCVPDLSHKRGLRTGCPYHR